MKKITLGVFALGLLFFSNSAQAATLTFDDLPTTGGFLDTWNSSYGGFVWNQVGYKNGSVDNPLAVVSAPIVIYNLRGRVAAINAVGGVPFSFNGGWSSSAFNDDMSLTITGSGVNNYETTVNLNTQKPVELNLAWSGITHLMFSGTFQQADDVVRAHMWIADNLSLAIQPVSNVPLPAALPLFGGGQMLLAAFKRKKV